MSNIQDPGITKPPPIPVGVDSFKEICKEGFYYVDKTLLIRELIDSKSKRILFTRPRRFGKSLNLNMLKTFFEKTEEDTSIYFRDKLIWECGDAYTQYQGQYPVVHLSLKDVRGLTWEHAFGKLRNAVRHEYQRHLELMKDPKPEDARRIAQMERFVSDPVDDVEVADSLERLTYYLNGYYGVPAVILMDEYDAPVAEAWRNRHKDGEYFEKMVQLMRELLSSALKGNEYCSFACLTGIQRVAKEESASGLNNLEVYGVLSGRYDEFFGFTHEEVRVMSECYDVADRYPEICEWYQGYRFGNVEVFNPLSVLSFIASGGEPRSYWGNVSRNTEIKESLYYATTGVLEKLSRLMKGETVVCNIKDELVYPALSGNSAAIFTLLLGGGFLTAAQEQTNKSALQTGKDLMVTIPNKELREVYAEEVLGDTEGLNYDRDVLGKIRAALIHGNAAMLQDALCSLLLRTVSYFDVSGENAEIAYHMFFVGLLLPLMGDYAVLSNEESGDGRYDICLAPIKASDPGIILELKAAKKPEDEEDLDALAEKALAQIDDKKYAVTLRRLGIDRIFKFGIAFRKKHARIVFSEEMPPYAET